MVVLGIGSRATSSPAMTCTLMLPERRTRSWTTEPYRISNHRDRADLPMTICVTLLACAKPITSSATPPSPAGTVIGSPPHARARAGGCRDGVAAESLRQPQLIRDPVALFLGPLQAAPCLHVERRERGMQ